MVFKRALIFIYNFESIYLRIPLVYINGKILVWTLENWTLLPNFKKSRSTNQSNCVELLKWILRNSLLELQIKFKFEICWTSTGGWKCNLCETFFYEWYLPKFCKSLTVHGRCTFCQKYRPWSRPKAISNPLQQHLLLRFSIQTRIQSPWRNILSRSVFVFWQVRVTSNFKTSKTLLQLNLTALQIVEFVKQKSKREILMGFRINQFNYRKK